MSSIFALCFALASLQNIRSDSTEALIDVEIINRVFEECEHEYRTEQRHKRATRAVTKGIQFVANL
jgi:hypothetical protein